MFEENHVLMMSVLNQSRGRLEMLGGSTPQMKETISQLLQLASSNILHCQVVFVACLNMDMQLKKMLMDGLVKYKLSKIPEAKAALFFLYLETDIILPWIMDERMSHATLIRNVKDYYLLS
jgi:hypothetical protein